MEDVDVDILNNIFESTQAYFNTLSKLGYKKQGDVNKLLVYMFIGELLTGDMRHFITKEDYETIEKALYCLYGSSCLIPYPQYANDDYLFGHLKDGEPRSTEYSEVRSTENSNIRIKASNYNR